MVLDKWVLLLSQGCSAPITRFSPACLGGLNWVSRRYNICVINFGPILIGTSWFPLCHKLAVLLVVLPLLKGASPPWFQHSNDERLCYFCTYLTSWLHWRKVSPSFRRVLQAFCCTNIAFLTELSACSHGLGFSFSQTRVIYESTSSGHLSLSTHCSHRHLRVLWYNHKFGRM